MKQNTSKHFCLIPINSEFLKLDPQTDYSILAITCNKDELIISIKESQDGKVSIYHGEVQKLPENKVNVSFERIRAKQTPGYEVTQLGTINDHILILYKKSGENYGVLVSLMNNSKSSQISKNVLCFAANTQDPNKLEPYPIIAAIVGQEINIFVYKSTTNKDGNTESKWENDFSSKIQMVNSVALSYPYVFALSPTCASFIDLSQSEDVSEKNQIQKYDMKFEKNPFCMKSKSSAFFAYADQMFHIIWPGIENGDFQTYSLNTEVPLYSHARFNTYFNSVFSSGINVYHFNSKNIKYISTVNLPSAKYVLNFNDSFVVAASDKKLYFIKDFSNAYNLIIEEKLDEAHDVLKSIKGGISANFLAAIFEQLWRSDFKTQSLSMLHYKEIYPAITDIICLFKNIKLVNVERGKYLTFAEQVEDQKLIKILVDHLLEIRKYTSLPPQDRLIINTAIFEIYSWQEDIGNLSTFIKESPNLLNDSLDDFFDKKETGSHAMYLAYNGNAKDSISIFKKLGNLNTILLDQIKSIIIQASSNWDFCKDSLRWFFTVSPLFACQVLTNEAVNSANALNFCCKEFKQYSNIVLHGVLDHKDIVDRPNLVKTYAQTIFQLLLEINSDDFKLEKVAFCKCVIEDKANGVTTPIEKIKEELGDDFIDVLRRFPTEVDIKSAIYQTNEISSNPRVQVEIYRAAGDVEKALQLLWNENARIQKSDTPENIDLLEKFCQEYDDPTGAFQALIKLAKEKYQGQQGIDMLMGILSRNMIMIDIPAALANINEDEPVENVAAFLEDTYRILSTMREDAELDAAFAESNEFESSYQRLILEQQFIEVRTDMKCPKCNKPLSGMYLIRTPDGELYHHYCLTNNDNS